jgi:DNA modification methylase
MSKKKTADTVKAKRIIPQPPPPAAVPARATKLDVQWVPINSISPDPANVRKHPEKNLNAIIGSLRAFGQQKPIVVDRNNVVRAGNGTLAAAKSLGWTEIAIVVSDLSPTELVSFAIADNRTSELAKWDDEALSDVLKSMLNEGVDMKSMGWDDGDLTDVLGNEWMENPPSEIPLPPDNAISEAGDIWLLGNHRLMCGDSTKPDQLDRLLAGAQIHLINTDPPYNVKVEPRSNNAIAAGLSSFQATNTNPGTHHQSLDLARHPEKSIPTQKKLRAKDRPLMNDFVTDESFDLMLDAWFGNMSRVLIPGGSFYIWGGYANLGNYPPFLKKNNLYFSQGIIWDKEHPVLTRKDFMGAFEIAFYGWKEGAGHNFYGPNNATDLWHIKKVTPQNMVHLTEKPVELAERALMYSSLAGQNVLDLFGGSGSTMVAAEQTGRKAFLMELDPLYCDVIVARWEKLAGRKAERIRGNPAK